MRRAALLAFLAFLPGCAGEPAAAPTVTVTIERVVTEIETRTETVTAAPATLEQEIAALGIQVTDIEAIRNGVVGMCGLSFAELQATISSDDASVTGDTLAVLRLGFRHLCPERMAEFDAAVQRRGPS